MGEAILKLGDEKLIEKLTDLAAANHRSLDSEAEAILRQAIVPKKSRAERVRRANEIAAMTPRGRILSDSVLMVREERRR